MDTALLMTGVVLALAAFALAVTALLRQRPATEQVDIAALRSDWEQALADRLPTETRFEIMVTDWGPDFTGEEGTLPRWRWVILDADRDVRAEAGQQVYTGSLEHPFMLGNSFNQRAAYIDALRWIEREMYPARVVIGKGAFGG